MFLDGPPSKMPREDPDSGRTGRVRKKTAKVMEMEEFEHIEKTADKKPIKKPKTPKSAQKGPTLLDAAAYLERPKKVKNVKAISGTVVGDISRPVAMISTPVNSTPAKIARMINTPVSSSRMITTPVIPKSNKVAFKLEPETSDSSPIKQETVLGFQMTSGLAAPGVTNIKITASGVTTESPAPVQQDQKSMIKYLLNSPSAGGKTPPSAPLPQPDVLVPTPVTLKPTGNKAAKKTKSPVEAGPPKTPKAKPKKIKQVDLSSASQDTSLSESDISGMDSSGMESSTPTFTPMVPSLKMKINLGPVPSSAVVPQVDTPKPKKSKKVKQEVKQELSHDSFTSDASPGFGSESDGDGMKLAKKPAAKKSKKKEKIMMNAISAAKQMPALAALVSPQGQPTMAGFSLSPGAATQDAAKPKKPKKKPKTSPSVALSSPPEPQLSMSEEMEDEDDETGLVIAETQVKKKEKVLKKKASGKGKSLAKSETDEKKIVEKRAPTAYMLFCNTHRPTIVNENPGIEFAAISKKLGEMWQTLSNKQKLAWRRKAQRRTMKKESSMISTGKNPSQLGQFSVSQGSGPQGEGHPGPRVTVQRSPRSGGEEAPLGPSEDHYSIEPIDVAAHLKLLGESLSIIGMRLQEHKGMIAVQGSLSVLLDSFVCACGPLLCLTQQVPGLDGCSPLTHAHTLDSVAYVMPGL